MKFALRMGLGLVFTILVGVIFSMILPILSLIGVAALVFFLLRLLSWFPDDNPEEDFIDLEPTEEEDDPRRRRR